MQLLNPINAKELAGLLTIVACFVFTGFAMWVEPTGEIHDSVLYLVCEMFSFAGICFGLDYFTHRSSHKQHNTPRKKNEGRNKEFNKASE